MNNNNAGNSNVVTVNDVMAGDIIIGYWPAAHLLQVSAQVLFTVWVVSSPDYYAPVRWRR